MFKLVLLELCGQL